MAEIVNFNKARKARDKAKKRAKTDENTVKFGRSKSQKSLERARTEKAARDHAGHKRDTSDESDA